MLLQRPVTAIPLTASRRHWSPLRLLVRETSGAKVIPQIDGLRFFAIASVVLFHITLVLTAGTSRVHETFANPQAAAAFGPSAQDSTLRTVLMGGGIGVELFFAISGMVLGLPFARHYLGGAERVPLRSYFLRRVTRIEPPYVIALLFFLSVWVIVRHEPIGELLPHFAAHLFYLHNVVFPGDPGLCSVLWSLEIEVQFYILAPLLATVFAIKSPLTRRAVIVGAVVALGAAQYVLPLGPGWGEVAGPRIQTIANYLHFFLVGFLLADLYVTRWSNEAKTTLAWDALGAAAWAGIVTVACTHTHVNLTLPPLLFIGCAAAFKGTVWKRFFSWTPIYVIGGMCYTIYLYHTPIIQALKSITTRIAFTDQFWVNITIQSVLMCSVVLAVCAVFFVLFEKPFMRKNWPQQLAQRIRRSHVSPSVAR